MEHDVFLFDSGRYLRIDALTPFILVTRKFVEHIVDVVDILGVQVFVALVILV